MPFKLWCMQPLSADEQALVISLLPEAVRASLTPVRSASQDALSAEAGGLLASQSADGLPTANDLQTSDGLQREVGVPGAPEAMKAETSPPLAKGTAPSTDQHPMQPSTNGTAEGD